jgi:hypothetical protein
MEALQLYGWSTARREMNWRRFLWMLAVGIGLLILSQGQIVAAQGAEPPPEPLPHDCGGFTGNDNACCMMGYVHYISTTLPTASVAEGATVTLSTASGLISTSTTMPGIHNEGGVPYFSFDLFKADVEPGTWVTVTAAYRGKRTEVAHQVAPGGQQVDVVLPVAQGIEGQTVIVDDEDLVGSPDMPGFHISGPAEKLTEAACGAGSEFWGGTIYSGMTTADGVGPATITATYRPTLPVTGAYEVFAYAPHGCAAAMMRYRIYADGDLVATPVIYQDVAGQYQEGWISLGEFEFPAGGESYIQVDNFTGRFEPVSMGFDALKWDLRPLAPPLATITVDDLEETSVSDRVGFYKNEAAWAERWTADGCDDPLHFVSEPVFWEDHIYWTYNESTAPRENWAQWRPDLPLEGRYDVYAFVTHCFATSRAASYQIYAGDTLVDTVAVDSDPQGGVWVHLGTYELDAGASSYVYLDDVTGEDHSLLAFDAIRWVARPDFNPISVVQTVSPDPAMRGEDVVTLQGKGIAANADREIAAYEWRWADSGELLGTDSVLTVTTESLSIGQHALTFRVQDDEGYWSHPVTTTFDVQSPPLGKTWHFMLYLAGDNNLSSDFQSALARLEQVNMLDAVTVTAQVDEQGEGGVWRYHIQSDGEYTDGINRWYLGELNSGDPQSLADYVLWARENYTADNVYLAVADHGRGVQGIGWDDHSNDYLTLPQLREALQQGTEDGEYKIDVLHLDACLMSMVEVAHEVWPYADYMVASENLGWGVFAYDRYVQALAPDTTEAPRHFAKRVAQIYEDRISRAPYTIAALDLSKVHSLSAAVDALAGALIAASPEVSPTVETALSYVQRLDSQDYTRLTAEDEFIDLRHFAELLAAISTDAEVRQAAQDVLEATTLSQAGEMTTTLLYEGHDSGCISQQWMDLEKAYGIAIYFPNGPTSWDYPAYVDDPVLEFGKDTRWDDFLHQYVGVPITVPGEPTPPDPLKMYRVFLPLLLRE